MKKIFLLALPIVLLLNAQGYAQTTTFVYTGAVQTYTIPAGVTLISIDAQGAKGGGTECGGTYEYQSAGGCGGRVVATLNVTPGHILDIVVGQKGTDAGVGGYGGGGTDEEHTGGLGGFPGAGGGGGTTITDATGATTLVVAGGGGGGGGDYCAAEGEITGAGDEGGAGGNTTAAAGNSNECGAGLGGRGGRPAAGGAAGTCDGDAGSPGTAGTGGNYDGTADDGSGGGGGGWYGGGSGAFGGGGGGGSSYSNPLYTTSVVHTQGYNCANGEAIITVLCSAGTITPATSSVCVGSQTNLTDATTGGTWTSSATAIATVGSTTGLVTGVGPGTATITYTVPAGCYTTAIVTINPNPSAIGGITTVCQGSTTTLTDASGTSTWTSSTTAIASVGSTTGIVTGVSTGTSEITFTITSTGCFTVTPVTVNPIPAAITGTLSICAESTTDLTDVTAGGTWSSSNTAVGTVGSTTGFVYGVGSGTTTITYMLSTGCIQTIVVTVNSQPVAISGNTGPICQTFTLNLTDGISGGIWTSLATGIATVTGTGLTTGVGVDTTTIVYSIGSCIATTVVTVNTQPAAITGAPFSMCDGSSITITDATGGGVWSSSTTVVTLSAGETVSGGSVGTSTIMYEIGSCFVTQVVTVNTQPVAITGNTGPICRTFTLNLTDGTTGGAWTSLATGIATVTGTGLTTGVGVDTTTIVYAIGSCIATTVVTVNTQPVAITGAPFAMCDGSSITITDATAGGVWSTSTTAVGLSAGETVSGMNVGTSTIMYEIGNCFVTQVVTVNTQPVAISGNTGPICQTFTLSLSDGTGGGTWSSSNTLVGTIGSASGTVTGIGAGTTTITYTIGSCSVTTVVTVNTQPAAISGTFVLCQGSSTTLTDATGGGTWSSSNTLVGTIGSTSGTITGVGVGTSTIMYEIGMCFVTQNITVNTQPVAITGNTGPICQTFTLPLSDGTGGGLWTSVTTTVGTIGSISGIVTGIGTGTTVISYAIGSCVATTIVTVDTQPDPITGTLSVCQGLTTSLNDGTGGGIWSSVNTTVGTISTTGMVTGLLNGTTTISYTLGICAAKAVVTVDPLPLSITGPDTVCSGATADLHDGTGGGTWSSSNTSIATIGSITGVVTGGTVTVTSTATITYTVGTGCIITMTITVNPLPTAILGPDAVCLGSTVTLSDAGGGTWTSNNTTIATIGSTTGLVTGQGVGVTTIIYTLPTSCYTTAPMTVNPLPSAITGPTLVCVGSTITLSDLTPGGAWSSSNTSLATVSATGIVSGILTGVVTITYTLSTGCFVTYPVTVNTPAAIITPVGDTIFCPGGFVALTANTGAGLSYQWYVGGVAISGALSSSYIATLAGSYQVEVTNSSGCSAFSIPMSVTIDTPVAVITASGATTICSGSSITLSANLGAGLSYQWLLGGVAITGAVGSSYTTGIGGDYSVVVTTAVGCSATSNVITISINPSPTANITLSGPLTFCQEDSVVMTTALVAGNSYQWYNAFGAIPGANSQSLTATASGAYYVTVTNGYGCSATSIVIDVVVNPLPDVTITASGLTLFCSGGSVTLSATAVGGDTYQWYVGGSLITGATTSSYLVTASGGYQVQVTDPATGCSATTLADTTVTVVGTPVIIPITPASFCWGGSALLSTSLSGATGAGVTFQWMLNGVDIPGATGPTYNAAVPGNYSCQITIPASCTAATLTVPVTEFPLPDPVVTLVGTTLETYNYYVTYQWYKNLVPIAGAITYSTTSTGVGDYKVAVTDTNGCQSYSDVFVDTTSVPGGGTTAIANVNNPATIKIYPNPAQTMIHIAAAMQVRAVINSIDGRAILNITDAKDIDITTLPNGIYMIMIYDENANILKTEKIIKATE